MAPDDTPRAVATNSSDRVKFASGAVRGTDVDHVRYDLVTPIGLRRLAETYAEGAKKYAPRNWEKGIPASNLLNHLINHIERWRAGDRSEDHLAHAAWGLFALMHFEEVAPALIDLPVPIPSQEP